MTSNSQRSTEQYLDPGIADAIETWILVLLRERRGKSIRANPDGSDTFKCVDLLQIIHEEAPDAIARMLQAGAAKYITGET